MKKNPFQILIKLYERNSVKNAEVHDFGPLIQFCKTGKFEPNLIRAKCTKAHMSTEICNYVKVVFFSYTPSLYKTWKVCDNIKTDLTPFISLEK